MPDFSFVYALLSNTFPCHENEREKVRVAILGKWAVNIWIRVDVYSSFELR